MIIVKPASPIFLFVHWVIVTIKLLYIVKLSCIELYYLIGRLNKDINNKNKQCGIFTSVDSDEPVQPPFKLRNSK